MQGGAFWIDKFLSKRKTMKNNISNMAQNSAKQCETTRFK